MKDRLKTPDAPLVPLAYRHILITVPDHADILAAFWGAVYGVSFQTSWTKKGTMEVDEAAEHIKNILSSRMDFDMLGAIFPVIRETLHSSMLICDGTTYNKSDYPQLWEVWPSGMKDAISLTLPDLRNVFLIGAGSDYTLGQTGGEAEVTLTVDELPAHGHGYTQPTFGVDIESVGVPDPTGVGNPPLPQVTDDTGGNQPHNNLPPFFAVVYAVVAKVQP